MEPVSLIVTSLALGAAAGLKPAAEQAVKEAYSDLKSLIQRKYAKVSVEQLEEVPESKARRAVVEEDLTQAGADKDEEVLRQAQTLLDAIQAHVPETASAIGVDLAEIKAAPLNIEDIAAQATGVRVRQSVRPVLFPILVVLFEVVQSVFGWLNMRRPKLKIGLKVGREVIEIDAENLSYEQQVQIIEKLSALVDQLGDNITINRDRRDRVKAFQVDQVVDRFPFKLSLLHPRKLSKGLSSPFIVLIYPPEKRQEANVLITQERRKWLGQRQELQEDVSDAKLPTGLAVNIKISSPTINFSGEVTKKLLADQLNSLHFNGQPKDTCISGIHSAVLSITNKETGHEYKSMQFPVTVVDFAFDHVSSPWLSNLTSVVLGIGSAATFALTFLGQVDQTLGLASGGAAGAVAGFIHIRYLSLFKLPRTSVNS
jgi:hypothetical protein